MIDLQEKVNLLDLDRKGLTQFFIKINEKPFRAQQMLRWIHQKGVIDFDEMTDLSHALREKLKQNAYIRTPGLLSMQHSKDGTRKWLFSSFNNSAIETVYIPEKNRATLCISSQVGCALNCKFCHTAQQGFQRNLTPAEIIGQLWYVVHTLRKEIEKENPVTNVVFMGMGEPLLNYENVLPTISVMQDDIAYNLSKKRVTLSTSGVLPFLEKFIDDTDIALAVSLHAPNDTIRTEIMPINKKYPLADLIKTCKRWTQKHKRRKVTIEYVMLAGINDQKHHAHELVKILNNFPAKVNLIPFNPFTGADYKCSSKETIQAFQEILMAHDIITIVRRTRGDDIDAACGQLAGRVLDRTKRSQAYQSMKQYQLPVVVNTAVSQESTIN